MSSGLSLLVVILALAATGCLRSTTTVAVEPDGSGRAEILVTVDPQAVADQVASTPLPLPPELIPDDPAAVCDSLGQAARALRQPAGSTVEPVADGDLCGQSLSFPFADPNQLTEAFETLANRESAGPILSREGDRWTFDAPLLRPTDLLPRGDQTLLVDQLSRQQEVTYVLTLPGTDAGGNNADSVDGGTFTWTIGPDDTRQRLIAVTDPDGAGGGVPVVPVAVGAAGLATVAGLGAWYATRRQRRPAPGPVAHFPGGDDHYVPVGAPTAGAGPATTGSGTPGDPLVAEPRWDPQRGAWVADHPLEGLLVHDDATGQWHRAT